MRHTFATTLLGALLTVPLAAQGCPTGTDTFWKRDTLPVTPAGLTGVSIIQGLCEGESAGVVFEMPANMGVQQVTQVVAPWGAVGGTAGFLAQLDLEVYDGVSFNGASVNMGTRVFSLGNLSQAMQVQSHGLNTLDVSAFNIQVGSAPPNGSPFVRRFAICFRVDVNAQPGRTCATGYTANFFTDNSQGPGLVCNNTITPQRTSLIEISGQGWRDAALATVSGIPLCPLYYSGIWAIRCCTRDAFPALYSTFAPGCAGSRGVTQLQAFAPPRIGQTLNVLLNNLPLNAAFLITGWSDSTSTLGPLPASLTGLGAPGCFARVSLDATNLLFGSNFTALSSMSFPNAPGLLGVRLYQQALVLDPTVNALGGVTSDAAMLQLGQ